jgi:hypothetical protein
VVCQARRLLHQGMARVTGTRSETERIEFLLHRDGYEATHAWVVRTLNIYRATVEPGQHGSDSSYRWLFEQSIKEFEAWLASHHELAANHRAEIHADRHPIAGGIR